MRGRRSAARSATTPAARARCATAAPPTTSSRSTLLTARGERVAARSLRPRRAGRRRPDRRRARALVAAERGADPHRVRPVPPAGLGLLARAPAARERRRPRQVPRRHRGHARRRRSARPSASSRRRRPSRSPCSATPTCRAPPRRCRRCCRTHRSRSRAWTRGWSTSCGAVAARLPCPTLPRGAGWLFVETSGAHAGRGDRQRREAHRRRRLASTPPWSPGPPARALWRIREDGAGLGGRTPAGAPAWPGWEDAAVPPEQLRGYLREFDALLREHRLDGLRLRPLRRRLRARAHRLPVQRPSPGRFRAFVLAAAALVGRHGGSMSGEHGDGRARGELLPFMYSPHGDRHLRRRQARLRPGRPAQPGRDRRSGTGRRRPARAGGPTADHATSAFAYPHDGGDLSTAVHRCVGVGKCRADTTATGGVMCPSYLATRDEKDSTRGRARVLQELANGTLVARRPARPRCTRRSTCACRARDARSTARPASTWRPTRPRCCTSATGAGCARRRTTAWAGCRAGPGWRRERRGLANALLRRPALGGAGQTARRHRRAAPAAAVRGAAPSAPGSPTRPAAGTPVLLWVDTFTDHFSPRSARRRSGARQLPATPCRSRRGRCAAG